MAAEAKRIPSGYRIVLPEDERGSLGEAFRNQFYVIRALLLRELKGRFAKRYLGYLWLFFEPIGHIALVSTILTIRGRQMAAGIELPVFVLSGVVPMIAVRQVISQTMSAVDNNRGMFNYRRVRPIDTMFARLILEGALFYFVFTILNIVAVWAGFDIEFSKPMSFLYASVCMLLMGFGIGQMFSIVVHFAPDAKFVVSTFTRILYFTSGVFFTVQRMPAEFRPIALINPMLHGVEMIREGFFAGVHVSYGDPVYLGVWTIILFSAGMLSTFAFRNRYYHYYDR